MTDIDAGARDAPPTLSELRAGFERWLSENPERRAMVEAYRGLPPETRRQLQVALVRQAASLVLAVTSLGTLSPVAGALAPLAASLVTTFLLRHPDAAEHLDAPPVVAVSAGLRDDLARVEASVGELRRTIDARYEQARSLPARMRNAAAALIIGIAGTVSFEAGKYAYSVGEDFATAAEQSLQEEKSQSDADTAPGPVSLPVLMVTGDHVRMRAGPSFEAEVEGHLGTGDRVVLLSEKGEWREILTLAPDGRTITCWMHATYLSETEEAPEKP